MAVYVSGDNNFGPTLKYTSSTNCLDLDPDTYYLSESDAAGWIHTTDTLLTKVVEAGNTTTAEFGNVCEGAGGGLTLGFWSNKNGQSLETVADFQLLTQLNLRNASGGNQDFTGTLANNKTALANWLLTATATNMAYMLSAQLATMELNVNHYGVSNKFGAGVNGNSLVYAPCLLDYAPIQGLNTLGFISINDLMSAANAELLLHGLTKDGSPYRAYQECLKSALDDANNNKNFLQSSPAGCPPLPW
jgi:hypothetical protein